MKNEPQLSAEMEKRLMDLLPLGLDDWLVEDIKHFLVTALEEQKQELLSEVEGWLVDEDSFEISKSCIDDGNVFSGSLFLRVEAQNNFRAELRTKLNQLKGTDAG